MVRGRLLCRKARATLLPVAAWAAIVERTKQRASYTNKRSLGGFLLPTLFGIMLNLIGVYSSCFMLLYGIVWVSLILSYLTEVRRTRVIGNGGTAAPPAAPLIVSASGERP